PRSRVLSRRANWPLCMGNIRRAAVGITTESHSSGHRDEFFCSAFDRHSHILPAMNRPDTTSRSRRWRTPALIALGASLVIEVLFIGQAMHLDSFDLLEAMKITLPRSLVWLVFAPVSVWLAFRFPLERGRLSLSLTAHLAACAVLVAASHWALHNFASV